MCCLFLECAFVESLKTEAKLEKELGQGQGQGQETRGLANVVLLAAVIKKYCIVIILFLCALAVICIRMACSALGPGPGSGLNAGSCFGFAFELWTSSGKDQQQTKSVSLAYFAL